MFNCQYQYVLQANPDTDASSQVEKKIQETRIKEESSQVGSSSRQAPLEGVFPLCEHFLQDNRKGQAFQRPKPCSKCTKHSKVSYGIWRSSKKEWQVMRPYPKNVKYHVPFQLCWYFSDSVKCRKSPCTFAHGKKELMFWTTERQSGRL